MRSVGFRHRVYVPPLQTLDGWINVGSANQGLWEKLVILLGASELAEDARFSDPNLRLANLFELNEILTTHFKNDTTENWISRLEEAGIPCGPVLDIADMSAHPQAVARAMVQEIDHGLRVIGHPVKYRETPAAIRRGAPKLGEHTGDVLAEAGYSINEINVLVANEAVLLAD